MTHTLPQLLPHCKVPTQHFCKDCRDRERGRTFRRGVLQRQGIEGVHPDFLCPLRKPWTRRWHRLIPRPGDTAHWLANLTLAGPTFRAWLRLTGSTCQCAARRRAWNQLSWPQAVKAAINTLRKARP